MSDIFDIFYILLPFIFLYALISSKPYQALMKKKKEILAIRICGISFTHLVALIDGAVILFSGYIILFIHNIEIESMLFWIFFSCTFNIVAILLGVQSQTIFSKIFRAIANPVNITVVILVVFSLYLDMNGEGHDIFGGFGLACAFGLNALLNMLLLSKNVEATSNSNQKGNP